MPVSAEKNDHWSNIAKRDITSYERNKICKRGVIYKTSMSGNYVIFVGRSFTINQAGFFGIEELHFSEMCYDACSIKFVMLQYHKLNTAGVC